MTTETNGEKILVNADKTAAIQAQEEDIANKLKLEELRLRIQEKSEFLDFRKQWSKNLLKLLVLIVLFNALFLIAVGLRWLIFLDEWLVRLIIAGSFLEVIALAKIVVDFLFKEQPKA
jgi:hypothetical protein